LLASDAWSDDDEVSSERLGEHEASFDAERVCRGEGTAHKLPVTACDG